MNSLLFPYIFNILILIPVGFGALFNIFPVSKHRFPESAGWRTLVGSLWVAILAGSFIGLFEPLVFSSLLFLQVVYKGVWLLVYVLPRLWSPSLRREIHWEMTAVFALIVALYPLVIPWGYLFGWSLLVG